MKVKLTGAVRHIDGVFHEYGAVVDLDKAEADRLIEHGVAEPVPAKAAPKSKAKDDE